MQAPLALLTCARMQIRGDPNARPFQRCSGLSNYLQALWWNDERRMLDEEVQLPLKLTDLPRFAGQLSSHGCLFTRKFPLASLSSPLICLFASAICGP